MAKSHLAAASRVADRIYAIDRGEIIFQGTPDEFPPEWLGTSSRSSAANSVGKFLDNKVMAMIMRAEPLPPFPIACRGRGST